MSDFTVRLNTQLELLRADHAWMLKTMSTSSISNFLGLGYYTNGLWRKYPPGPVSLSPKKRYIEVTPEETFRIADMRQLLLGLFWTLQARPPLKNVTPEDIGDDAFWLEFMQLAKAAKWQAKRTQQAILNSDSMHIPQKVRVAAWFFLLSRCHLPGNHGTILPPEAFEQLDHFDFTPEQKARWDMLLGFGMESMFKKQLYRTSMAMDLFPAELPDWFSFALAKRRADIVCSWLEKYPLDSLGMSLREIMLYTVANYRGGDAVKIINCLEKMSPGLCAGFQDRHGNNLLWYTAVCWQLRSQYATPFKNDGSRRDPNSAPGEAENAWRYMVHRHGERHTAGNRKLLERLIRCGIKPDQKNHYGFSFQDLDQFAQMINQRWSITRLRKQDPPICLF
ncbi:MAG: hypothetical protein GX927_11270 [Lentisphaerae bacterium]|nr:hypothetical protein [Lentisphaerota bacterium]